MTMSRQKHGLRLASLVGGTPCISLPSVSRAYGYMVYGKVETVNPTGSHKDRESIEILKYARRGGFVSIACASTGNAAISLSAFSRMAGIKCHIYVSADISEEKSTLIEAFGSIVHRVPGGYEAAVSRSEIETRHRAYLANPGTCPAKIVGNSNIGKEIAAAIEPEYVVCPTNNGTHLVGVWKGLRASGQRPSMVAATARTTKIADSIHGFHGLERPCLDETIKESNGMVVNVTDQEIANALILLLRDGVIAEPAAAAGVAALRHLNAHPGSKVCCTITGSGVRFPRRLRRVLGLKKSA